MNEWFDPNLYAWIPGTLFGVIVGIYGGIAGMLVMKKKNMGVIKKLYKPVVGMSIILFLIGVVALVVGQPFGIWYGFLLPGILGILSLRLNKRILYTDIKISE